MPRLSHIGIVGLGTMGSALAQNFLHHDISVSVYNRTFAKTKSFAEAHGDLVQGFEQVSAFVSSLQTPRKIIVLVPDGKPVDMVINGLLNHLEPGDCIIDGGNSFYRDTARREQILTKKGFHYFGCGISGGEAGALSGPSLMLGGSREGYDLISPLLKAIAAVDSHGAPCIQYFGGGGAGHYIKMVHNGIEYGIMQLLAEVYDVLHEGLGFTPKQVARVFQTWNTGRLASYLLEIAVPVLSREDGDAKFLIYAILDSVSSHGTGKWTVIDALDRGIPVPTISAAVSSRYISTYRDIRAALASSAHIPRSRVEMPPQRVVALLEDAYYTALISIYAEGYHLISHTAADEGWSVSLGEVSRIWEGGCIIRAAILDVIHASYSRTLLETDTHLFLQPMMYTLLEKGITRLREANMRMTNAGIPHSVFSSTLGYIEMMTDASLPTNLIQGLRDYFGAHTYERIDKPGTYHTDWEE